MSWRDIKDEREKYSAYLASREWAVLRRQVMERCRGVCERCNINSAECVHHLTYVRKYRERVDDLAAWCNACHEFTHAKTDVDPSRAHVVDRQAFIERLDYEADGGAGWDELYAALVCGLNVLRLMGKEWFFMAARGEFASRHVEDAHLVKLIERKRKEMGIS